MTIEQIYKISNKPGQIKYYQLLSSTGELILFYNKNLSKSKLIIQGNKDYITLTTSGILNPDIILNFLYFSKLNNIKFITKQLSLYNITGDYLNYSGNINWSWKPCQKLSNCFVLVDNLASNQAMARINNFTIDNSSSGTLFIYSGVPEDFRDSIVTSACLVWKMEQDNYDLGPRARALINEKIFSLNKLKLIIS